MTMADERSLPTRMWLAMAFAVVSVVLIWYGSREAIQFIAVPLDECIDLDAGGRFGFAVEWILISSLATILVVVITIPLAYFGWSHFAVGWLLCAGGFLVSIATYIGDAATLYSADCPIPSAWPGWLAERAGDPLQDRDRGLIWLVATFLVGLLIVVASAWQWRVRASSLGVPR